MLKLRNKSEYETFNFPTEELLDFIGMNKAELKQINKSAVSSNFILEIEVNISEIIGKLRKNKTQLISTELTRKDLNDFFKLKYHTDIENKEIDSIEQISYLFESRIPRICLKFSPIK